MSVRVSSLVWKIDAPAGEKIVLLKMADCANDQGESIYPSCAAVAKDCCCSERHVQRVWSKFRQLGILVCENTSGGRGKTTRYSFDMARLKGDTESRFSGEERATHSQGLGGQKGDTETANTCRPFDERVTSTTLKGDTESQKGDNGRIPPAPPIKENRHEPSLTVGGKSRPKSVSEVADYFAHIKVPNPQEEAEKFVAHFTMVGWVYGKQRHPIKDWKAACVTWKKNLLPSQGQASNYRGAYD